MCRTDLVCRSPVWDLPWLPGRRYHFPSTRHFDLFAVGFANSFSDLNVAPWDCVQLCVSSLWSSNRICIRVSQRDLFVDQWLLFGEQRLRQSNTWTSGAKTPNSPHICPKQRAAKKKGHWQKRTWSTKSLRPWAAFCRPSVVVAGHVLYNSSRSS